MRVHLCLTFFVCLSPQFTRVAARNLVVQKRDAIAAEAGESTPPRIYALRVTSTIQTRFATTVVNSRLANDHPTDSKEATFYAQLPDAAFISNFSMYKFECFSQNSDDIREEIGGKVIVGEVREKEKAKEAYDSARAAGQSAGHVAQTPRETDEFKISVNVGSMERVSFNLTYQEILKRVHGLYKHIINIQPGQVVDDLGVDVHVYEKAAFTEIHIPQFGPNVGEKTNQELKALPPAKDVQLSEDEFEGYSHLHAVYEPSVKDQKDFQKDAEKAEEGLAGQLVVLYDVERHFSGGELQAINGYFVHFFAPSGLAVAGKNIVFVLDRSGSMEGTKIQQTKDAMAVILMDLNESDLFNIIHFSTSSVAWSDASVPANSESVSQALDLVNGLVARGGTNIDDAMTDALELLANTNMNSKNPTIIFLTDGKATTGERNPDRIVGNIKTNNPETIVTIHSISFGRGADFPLLKRISLENRGLARKIYEDSDSALQMQGFYAEISNPLLSSVSIEYLNDTVEVDSLVKEQGYTYYDGSEVVVVGKFLPDFNNLVKQEETEFKSQVSGIDASGGVSRFFVSSVIPYPYPACMCCMPPCPHCPPPVWPTTPSATPLPAYTIGGFVERMWAYLTIKKLLDESKYLETDADKKEEMQKRALQLSLKYNFVTELTSMVVIQEDQDGNSSSKVLSEGSGDAPLPRDSGFMGARIPPSAASQQLFPFEAHSPAMRSLSMPHAQQAAIQGCCGFAGRSTANRRLTPLQIDHDQPALAMMAAPACPGPDERLRSCKGYSCDTASCSTLGTNHSCQVPADCANGARHWCDCAAGFVREAGRCLEMRHCPQVNCSQSEQPVVGCFQAYYSCEPECDDSPGDHVNCKTRLLGVRMLDCGDWVCLCRPGLLRNADGLCVEPSACPGAGRMTTTRRPQRSTTTRPIRRVPSTTKLIESGCTFDLIFILDASGSVDSGFSMAKRLAIETVSKLRIGSSSGSRVALIRYAAPGKTFADFSLNTHDSQEAITEAIRAARHISGITDTRSALSLAQREYSRGKGARAGVAQPIVLLFTDGYSFMDPRVEAERLRRAIPLVFAVGINSEYAVNTKELALITGDPQRVYTDENIRGLYAVLDEITAEC